VNHPSSAARARSQSSAIYRSVMSGTYYSDGSFSPGVTGTARGAAGRALPPAVEPDPARAEGDAADDCETDA
jgi:hypothetical protein